MSQGKGVRLDGTKNPCLNQYGFKIWLDNETLKNKKTSQPPF
jgi:hypothetical protein